MAALIITGVIANEHIGKFLDHRFKLKSVAMEIKKLDAQATLLKLKADPNYQECEDFIKDAIKAHKELT